LSLPVQQRYRGSLGAAHFEPPEQSIQEKVSLDKVRQKLYFNYTIKVTLCGVLALKGGIVE
jgi:hypothetical protein